MKQIAILT